VTDSTNIDFTLRRRKGEPDEAYMERQRGHLLDMDRDAMAEERRIAEAQMLNMGGVMDAVLGGRR
jgi:hypothetical protein